MSAAPFLKQKRIVVSQSVDADVSFARALEERGAAVHSVSSIRVSRAKADSKARRTLRELPTFDWVVFTSAKAVPLFVESVREMHGDDFAVRSLLVAAVGPATAAMARKYGFSVRFVPKKHTAKALAENLDGVQGKRILLPRAQVATAELPRILKARGARVTDLAVYSTEILGGRDRALEKVLLGKKIDYLVFTSPSVVRGLFAKVRSAAARKALRAIPVMAIGPVTGAKARRQGCRNVSVAATHTRAGILKALRTAEFMKSS